MIDQDNQNKHRSKAEAMLRKTKETDEGTRRRKVNFLDVTDLIRSIQRVEGNPECFRNNLRSVTNSNALGADTV